MIAVRGLPVGRFKGGCSVLRAILDPMSQQNVEIVRRMYDAFARGDFQSTLAVYDPDVVFLQRDDSNVFGRDVSGEYRGVSGLKGYMRKVFATWSNVRIEAEEITGVGEAVVAEIRMHVVGRGSRLPAELRYFHVWTFRGGRVIRLEVVPTLEEALGRLRE